MQQQQQQQPNNAGLASSLNTLRASADHDSQRRRSCGGSRRGLHAWLRAPRAVMGRAQMKVPGLFVSELTG